MDRRPKPRIWNGDAYESDADDDEKPRQRSSDSNLTPVESSDMRYDLKLLH